MSLIDRNASNPSLRTVASSVGLWLVAALAASACSAVPQGATTVESRESAAPLAASSAKAGDLVLTASVDSDVVAPGDEISIQASVANTGDQPARVFAPQCGGAVAGVAAFELPVDPAGRTWTGVAQTFKDYVLAEGLGPGAVPAAAPLQVDLLREPCAGGLTEITIGPGEVVESTLVAQASLVEDVPALEGPVPIMLTTAWLSNEEGGPSPEGSDGVPGGRTVLYSPLTLDLSVDLQGESEGLASLGEVVDAALADPEFMRWLDQRGPETWANANLFLIHVDETSGIVPAGSWWELDLFREVGVPRDSAIAFIDPKGATLRSVSYCEAPCD